jgi:hypothetical protein
MNTIRLGLMLFLLVGLSGVCRAEGDTSSRMVFLRLSLDVEGVRLLDAAVHQGVLKEPRSMPHPLVYRLLSDSGELLHTGTLPDPRVRRIESFPRQPGPARIPILRTESAEFSLRIPFHPGARRIEIFERAGMAEAEVKKANRRAVPLGKRLGGASIPSLVE